MDRPDAGARILIVEDELHRRRALEKCLAAEGYRVLLAADGERGLQCALKEKPDLVLLDIMMPRLDGFALCAELRRLANPVPVLILTARGQGDDRVRGLDAGDDADAQREQGFGSRHWISGRARFHRAGGARRTCAKCLFRRATLLSTPGGVDGQWPAAHLVGPEPRKGATRRSCHRPTARVGAGLLGCQDRLRFLAP